MKEKSISGEIFKWVIRVLILLFAVVPVYACLLVALTPYANVMEAQLLPKYFEFSNFLKAWSMIYPQLLNSFSYSILTVFFTLLISIPAAYVLARYRFKAREPMLFCILLTQMMAGIIVLPSLYYLYNRIGLLNTRSGLVLTLTGLNVAFTIWLLVGFFSTLPREVEEAAIVDGVSSLMLIVRIVIPMSSPGIATAAIFVFINAYNEFVTPLFLLTDCKLQTLTLRLYTFLSDTTPQWHVIASSSIIGLIPPVLIFIFFQRSIIGGITAGAVKS